jgi:hypothetical protein
MNQAKLEELEKSLAETRASFEERLVEMAKEKEELVARRVLHP